MQHEKLTQNDTSPFPEKLDTLKVESQNITNNELNPKKSESEITQKKDPLLIESSVNQFKIETEISTIANAEPKEEVLNNEQIQKDQLEKSYKHFVDESDYAPADEFEDLLEAQARIIYSIEKKSILENDHRIKESNEESIKLDLVNFSNLIPQEQLNLESEIAIPSVPTENNISSEPEIPQEYENSKEIVVDKFFELDQGTPAPIQEESEPSLSVKNSEKNKQNKDQSSEPFTKQLINDQKSNRESFDNIYKLKAEGDELFKKGNFTEAKSLYDQVFMCIQQVPDAQQCIFNPQQQETEQNDLNQPKTT